MRRVEPGLDEERTQRNGRAGGLDARQFRKWVGDSSVVTRGRGCNPHRAGIEHRAHPVAWSKRDARVRMMHWRAPGRRATAGVELGRPETEGSDMRYEALRVAMAAAMLAAGRERRGRPDDRGRRRRESPGRAEPGAARPGRPVAGRCDVRRQLHPAGEDGQRLHHGSHLDPGRAAAEQHDAHRPVARAAARDGAIDQRQPGAADRPGRPPLAPHRPSLHRHRWWRCHHSGRRGAAGSDTRAD